MKNSKTLAGLVGPALLAIGVTEAINLRTLEEAQPPPGLVYLNGGLLFVAGIAILRVHNYWTRRWPVIITITGWAILFVGVLRLIAPARATSGSGWVYGLLAVMVAAGAVLTYRGYQAEPVGVEAEVPPPNA
jgi:uncharacterized membrane protein HdeD (DUF308 family)